MSENEVCAKCGHKPDSLVNFCPNCGERFLAEGWRELKHLLSERWEQGIETSPDIFERFSASDWREMQALLKHKGSHYLIARSLDECNSLKQSEERYKALDTVEDLNALLGEYIESDHAKSDLGQLVAAMGTKAQLPYGPPNSGQSLYWPDVLSSVELEMDLAEELLYGERMSDLVAQHPHRYTDYLDLLSDFSRSALSLELGGTVEEQNLLRDWAPRKDVIRSDMTAILTGAAHYRELSIPRGALINPRMMLMLVDSENYAQAWWMEMGLWYSCASAWKAKFSEDLLDAFDRELATMLEDTLANIHQIDGGSELLEDWNYEHLLEFLKS